MPRTYSITTPISERDYDAYYLLRWACLRAPHNMPRGSERDAFDDAAHHVMAKNGQGKVIGVARLHLNEHGHMQIRYMAVAAAHRRLGIASAMLERLENAARADRHELITLNARENAVPFYLRRGYQVTPGNVHGTIADIKHYAMKKRL